MFIATLYSCYYELNYVVVGNLLGFSILTNYTLFYIFFFHKGYCNITKSTPILLSLINVIDIMGYYITFELYSIILKTVVSLIAIIILVFISLRKNENNNSK